MMKAIVLFLSLLHIVPVGGASRGLRGGVFPTRELAVLAGIEDYDAYEQLYLSLDYDPSKNSVQDLIKIRDDEEKSKIEIFGYGLSLGRGAIGSALAQLIWSGKIFSFETSDSPDLGSYVNIYFGQEFYTGVIYDNTLEGAMTRNGEDPPGGSLAAAGEAPMVLDGRKSLILDYIPGDLGAVTPLIDECRPLTKEALKGVGVRRIALATLSKESLADTYLCRGTNVLPLQDERTFFLHFAFQFDRDTIELTK